MIKHEEKYIDMHEEKYIDIKKLFQEIEIQLTTKAYLIYHFCPIH